MNSSNVVETPNSDIDRPSSVDCHDSEDDCNSTTSTSDSDSRYLLPASIIAPHAHRADSRIPMSHSTAEDYANAIRSSNNVFGSTKQTNSIRNLSHNTIKYTKSLTIIESRFFESLVENETLSSLASFDNDPDNGNQPIRRFYLIFSWAKTQRHQRHHQHCCTLVCNQILQEKIAPHSRKCF